MEWDGIPSKVEYLYLDRNRVRTLKGNPANQLVYQL